MEYFIQQCQAVIGSGGGLLFSLFIGGMLGSVGHCTGMCGPIVMAQATAGGSKGSDTRLARATRGMLLPYHLGRMTTYVLMGIIAASLSELMVGTKFHGSLAASMLLIAGILFIIKAFPVSRFQAAFKAPAFLTGVLRTYGHVVSKVAAPFSRQQTGGNLYFFGVMLGFLPCGLVMAAILAVASTGNPLLAAGGMALFCVGTIPVLASMGVGAVFAERRWPARMSVLTRYIMALNGFFLCAVALRLAL